MEAEQENVINIGRKQIFCMNGRVKYVYKVTVFVVSLLFYVGFDVFPICINTEPRVQTEEFCIIRTFRIETIFYIFSFC